MKLWGGRFQKNTASQTDDFNSSIHFDYQLYEEDILGSIAHASMLAAQNIISDQDKESIVSGLRGILTDIKNGQIEFDKSAEDIHMNVESILTERIGLPGKKLHTGRSRNDQVALDTRMYLKKEIVEIKDLLSRLCEALLTIASAHTETIMPGYTHLQKAQPITLAHHLLAYFEMFLRDLDRLNDCFKRTNVMPLGSGALATTTYPLDRDFVATQLAFAETSSNSLDAVSDRDYIIEFLSSCSLIMMHLSRFCEELILWSSNEFQFVAMDDAYSTGSSIMPQKKNPDVAELIRGKTGRVYGDLIAMLAVMKSLPLAYNKDMQEDKELLFDGIDTVKTCVDIFKNMISTCTFNQDIMYSQASKGFTNATDAADYLVNNGLPFRSAHEVIGRLVLYCIEKNKGIEDLSLNELQTFSELFKEDIYESVSLKTCVNMRDLKGGPSKKQTQQAIKEGQLRLTSLK